MAKIALLMALVAATFAGLALGHGLSNSEVNAYVSGHAKERRAVNQGPLIWDDEIAAQALRWAKRCQLKHSGWKGFGENLAMRGPTGSSEWALWAWVYEKNFYKNGKCDTGPKNPWGTCGHYTQIIRAKNKYFGCATNRCNPGAMNQFDYHVCQYSKDPLSKSPNPGPSPTQKPATQKPTTPGLDKAKIKSCVKSEQACAENNTSKSCKKSTRKCNKSVRKFVKKWNKKNRPCVMDKETYTINCPENSNGRLLEAPLPVEEQVEVETWELVPP